VVDKKEKIKESISFTNNPEFLKKIKTAEENIKKGNYVVLTTEYKKETV
jgi:hypothetical protein